MSTTSAIPQPKRKIALMTESKIAVEKENSDQGDAKKLKKPSVPTFGNAITNVDPRRQTMSAIPRRAPSQIQTTVSKPQALSVNDLEICPSPITRSMAKKIVDSSDCTAIVAPKFDQVIEPTYTYISEVPQDVVELNVETLLNLKISAKKLDLKLKSDELGRWVTLLKNQVRRDVKQIEQIIEERIKAVNSAQKKLEDQQSKTSMAEAATAILSQRLDSVRDSEKSLTQQLSTMTAELNEAVTTVATAKSVISTNETAISELRATIVALQEKIEDLRKTETQLRESNATLQEYNKNIQDYNQKLQTNVSKLQTDNCKFMQERNTLQLELSSVKVENENLKETLETTQKNNIALTEQNTNFRINVASLTAELDKTKTLLETNIADVGRLTTENKTFKELSGKSIDDYQRLHSDHSNLVNMYNATNELFKGVQIELIRVKAELQQTQNLLSEEQKSNAIFKTSESSLLSRVSTLETKARQDDSTRRILHNKIQELKGNIRVFCRIRPLLETEESITVPTPILSFNPPNMDSEDAVFGQEALDLTVYSEEKSQMKKAGEYKFTFDKVFQPNSDQECVFEEISELVQSALDGDRVCVFAYGQTGSGKTHTMMGSSNSPKDPRRGLIPRSVEKIFLTASSMKEQGWTFSIEASFLEIYNETIRDLLCSMDDAKEAGASGKYNIKHESNGNTVVEGLAVFEVYAPEQVYGLLTIADKNRAVAATKCNLESSRSHSVFTLKIHGQNSITGESTFGTLNLIDLAGSERLNKSKAVGDRLKETQFINKSLSALGDVICALAAREKHIPYRNSKLTYFLQPNLGGARSKTLMFVNASPTFESAHETLCSLRFASKVNSAVIGAAPKSDNKSN